MKKIIKGLLPLLLLITLCSCGTPPSEQSTTQDVDTAVDAIFKNSETSVKENRLNNDFIRVWPKSSCFFDEPPIWIQENLDGTGKKAIDIEDLSYVLWVTNDWIYYSHENEDGSQTVYRIPAERTEGARYNTAGKELLFEVKTDDSIQVDFFVTDDFIFYSQFDEDSGISTYYRYDLETGENTKVFTLGIGSESGADVMQNECTNLPVILEDSFFLCNDEGIYRVPLDTLKAKEICTGEDLLITSLVEYDGAAYFCGGEITGKKNEIVQLEYSSSTILKYDGKSGEITTVLSNSELKKVLEQVEKANNINLIDKNCYYNINDVHTYKDRLYVQIHTEAGAKAFTQTSGKNILLSAPFTNLDQWEMESSLTDYCLEQGMGDESTGVKGSSVIEGIYNGKVLFTVITGIEPSPPYRSAVSFEGYNAIYDIDTKKVEKLDDDDYRICQHDHY